MSTPKLDNTSYVVLGLVELCEPATPYDLKRFAEISVFNFWSVPHTRVYSECERLAAEGLLKETRESTGRRRRVYRMTSAGTKALDRWRSESSFEPLEFRDPGLIKLFFGADPAKVAETQLAAHRENLRAFEQLRQGAEAAEVPEGVRLTCEAGVGHAREYVRFWSRLAKRHERG